MSSKMLSCVDTNVEAKIPSDEELLLTEQLILEMAKEFDIRIRDDPATGRVVRDGPGDSPASAGEETALSSIWSTLKAPTKELIAIIFNLLRGLDAQDVSNAANIVRSSSGCKRDIVIAILEFISARLRKTAVSGTQERLEYKLGKPEK